MSRFARRLQTAAALYGVQSPQIRSTSSVSFGDTTLIDVPRPSGVVAGDVLLLFASNHSGSAFGSPSGWTQLATQNYGSGVPLAAVFWKVAGSSEPTSYSFGTTSYSQGRVDVVAVYGSSVITPIVTTATSASSATQAIAPSVTPASATDLLLCMATVAAGSGLTASWTAPGGMTELTDELSGDFVTMTVARQSLASASATGTRTFGATLNSSRVAGTISVAVPSVLVTNPGINPPAAPTNLTATPGDGAVTLSWNTPANNGGAAITGYRITRTPSGQAADVGVVTSTSVTGLTNGVSYSFTVSALNSAGEGVQSDVANATPEAATNPSAPEVRSVSSLSFGGTSTPTVAKPLGTASGDVLIAFMANDTGTALTAPSGWTQLATQNYGSGTPLAAVFWKLAGGSEPSTYVFGASSSADGRLDVIALTNAGTAEPVVITGTSASSSTQAIAPSVTPASTDDFLLCMATVAAASGLTASWTAPAGMAELTDANQAGYVSMTTASQALSSGAATGTRTFGATLNSARVAGVMSVAIPASTVTSPAVNPPGAPTGVTATAGNALAAISWTAPVSNGGAVITGYRITRTPGGQTMTVGAVTNATFTGLTNGTAYTFTVAAQNSAGYGANSSASNSVTPSAPSTGGNTTGGSGGAMTNRTFQSYTGAGLTGEYHIYAANVPSGSPMGLMLQFHGDAAYEFLNPTSSYSLGGANGIIAKADAANLLLVPMKAPDLSGTVTWWESGSANADYVKHFLENYLFVNYDIDLDNIWLVGYSGGAQFITQFFVPKHSSVIGGGTAVIFGGGGVPYNVTVQPFAQSLKDKFRMHWYTGQLDGANGGYQGYSDAQKGSKYYEDRGFTVSREYPPNEDHYNLPFGQVVGEQLVIDGLL